MLYNQTKACTKCGVEKSLAEFWKDKSKPDDHARVCKRCKTEWGIKRDARALEARKRSKSDDTKVCKLCGCVKPIDEFPNGTGTHGRHSWCTPCGTKRRQEARKLASTDQIARNVVSRRKYATGFCGTDVETARRIQNNCCAICHADFTTIGTKHTHADHNHATGEKRGLLCGPCNRALGLLNDSTILLRRAAEYLENPPLRGAR